ncbi:MAG: TlpA family protein disulfide reductase, partial [Thermoanaerobaculia bacterium]
ALGMRVRLLSNAPAAREPELLAAVDRLLALPPRRYELPPSPAGWAAGLYLERGVRLDRIPALLAEDLGEAGAEFQRRSAAGDHEAEPRYAWRRRENLRLRIGLALATSDSGAARRALDELARETEAAPGGGVLPAFRGAARFPDERTELDRLAARVLTTEGRGEDALGLLARLLPDPVLGPAIEREARAAWRAARGAEEGFEAWRTGLADGLAVAPWQAADRPPPAIPLTEFGGGPWSWDAQRGRTVVLFVWATWCTPCRDQLPWLEQLAERLAGRPDVAVVTVNVDRTNASLLPFLGEHDLALPVLTGGDRLFDEGLPGVPALWIVGADGRVRRELRGFAGGGEEWLAAALAEVEGVAEPAPVVSGGT